MNRLLCLSVSLFTLVLSGCGDESDTPPEDGRDFDGVEYSTPTPYTGRVIDGYLRNARVWLDMDGDSQYTPGPMDFELENGRTITLASGEPTAMTGARGKFSLDISELVLPSEVGPDLDPRDFPLYAVALPGQTVEETRIGDVPVSRAYVMSAAPGVRNVTPLTTVARYRQLVGLDSFSDLATGDAAALDALNLLSDYVLAGDHQAHAYAQALARFMASQIPDAYNAALSAPDADGSERFLSIAAARLLGISLLQNAGQVIAVVDAAAADNYANVDVDALVLPEVPLELSDPVLVTGQTIYAQPENEGQTLPVNRSDLLISAELAFDYGEDGRLLSISANGCMAPSLTEIARLVQANGYMADVPGQWRPAVSLSAQSRTHYEIDGVDERLLFDWEGQRIYFETATTCHQHEGIEAGSSALGGEPEVVYTWVKDRGDVIELTASSGATTWTWRPNTVGAPDGISGYTLRRNGSEQASLAFNGTNTACAADPDVVNNNLLVTHQYGYDFTGFEPQPVNFVDLALEYDTRQPDSPEQGAPELNRLLRFAFLDPALSELPNVDATRGFEWVMYYPGVGKPGYEPSNPNLIHQAYLKSYGGNRRCGRQFESAPTNVFARVDYEYKTLSDYLIGLLD